MIDWFERRDPDRPFLLTEEGDWNYGETAHEVATRVREEPVVLHPDLDPRSVFDVLAGICGGGAVVAHPDSAIDVGADLDGAALVVYTSGTSGPPKGVRLTPDNLEAASLASIEHLGHGPDDTWLLAVPLTHVAGLSILVRSARAGGSVRMLDGFDPARVARAMHGNVSFVSLVPTMLRRLLDHHPGPYSGLEAVLVGGGPIPEGLIEEAHRAGIPALPTYGMTETFGQVATLRPGAPPRRAAHPLPGVELRIEPDGRIALRGDQVSPGYLGEPDRSSQWLLTPDLGVIDDDGALRVLGRADALIVTGGENVDPELVERAIEGCPGVSGAVVVGVPDPEWGMAVACAYVGGADPADVAAWARDHLARHVVPRRWRRVDALPTTAIGKPDRPAAANLFHKPPPPP